MILLIHQKIYSNKFNYFCINKLCALKMKNRFRILSFIYLFFLSIVMLIPLDFFILNDASFISKQPSNEQSFFIHFILFFLLFLLFNFSFENKIKLLIFCIVYSILIETAQLFSLRGFQFGDILFNIIGLLSSFYVCEFLINSKYRRKKLENK